MKNSDTTYLAIKEMEKQILMKLDAIRTKVITATSGDLLQDLQILTLASDELDDVLLNWDIPSLDHLPNAPSSRSFADLDDLDDD